MSELTKEQKKELEKIAAEIEAEAIQMRIDYEQTPSEESGSIVVCLLYTSPSPRDS